VKKAIEKKRTMDSSKQQEGKQPSSNYPMKYLSLKSKTARYAKIELPQEQSAELCQLIESMESSHEGKKELGKIFNEANQLKSAKGH